MDFRKLNKTNFEHSAEALLGMLVLGFLTGNWLLAAIAPMAFFLGREHAQFEYKLVKQKGLSTVSELKPWEGFQIWKWSDDAKFDLICPVLTNAIFYFIAINLGISIF